LLFGVLIHSLKLKRAATSSGDQRWERSAILRARRTATVTTYETVLIPGDGIGPEVADAVRAIFEAAKAPIEWKVHHAGVAAVSEDGEVLPQATLDAVRERKVALKGPCTTPVGKGFRSVNVQLRKELDLYASVRPVRTLPGIETRYEDVDLVVLRENTEGSTAASRTR
jgi:isocitrate dehydrogenase (NAD+)